MAHHLGLEGHLSQDNINELQIFELPRENRGSNWISFHSEAFCDGSCLPYFFLGYIGFVQGTEGITLKLLI
jgi:putative heme iron utilization protein